MRLQDGRVSRGVADGVFLRLADLVRDQVINQGTGLVVAEIRDDLADIVSLGIGRDDTGDIQRVVFGVLFDFDAVPVNVFISLYLHFFPENRRLGAVLAGPEGVSLVLVFIIHRVFIARQIQSAHPAGNIGGDIVCQHRRGNRQQDHG